MAEPGAPAHPRAGAGEGTPWWREALAALAASLLLLLVLQFSYLHNPYYWDAVGYVQPQAAEILRNDLHPILRIYDVGHPTLFYWLVAVVAWASGAPSDAGPPPWAGRIVVWVFAAVFAASAFGLIRVLGVGRAAAAAGAGVLLSFPMVWAQAAQVLPDLPLAACVALAWLAWARRSWTLYFLAAGAACLVKYYGFLVVAGPVAALLVLASVPRWRGTWDGVLREAGLALSPLLALAAYATWRRAVRGDWSPTTGFDPIQKAAPVWRWGDFTSNLPLAWEGLVVLGRIHLVGGLAIVLVAWAMWRQRRVAGSPRADDPGAARRAALVMPLGGFLYAAALLQVQFVMSRYGMPVLAVAVVGLSWAVARLAPSTRAAAALLVVLVAVNVFYWKPERVGRLPGPAGRLLAPPAIERWWLHELDMRHLDAIKLMEWSAEKIHKRAAKEGMTTPGLAASFPIVSSITMPGFGYTDAPMRGHALATWEQLDPAIHHFAAVVPNLSLLGTHPPDSDAYDVEFIADRTVGELTATVYRIHPDGWAASIAGTGGAPTPSATGTPGPGAP